MSIVKEVLDKLNVKICKTMQGYYCVNAPYRNGSNSESLLIDCKSGRWKDQVEGISGDFDQFISKVLGRELNEREKKRYKEIEGQLDFAGEGDEKIQKIKIYDENYMMLFPNYTYWNNRGVSDATCREFGLGVCQGGALYNRIVFPIRNLKGQIIGYNGRDITNNPKRAKYKLWGNRSSNFCFPCHLADEYIKKEKRVVLVEGASDVIYLWEKGIKNVLCLNSLNFNKTILAYLISVCPNHIIVSTNNDDKKKKNWGELGAKKIKERLSKYFDEKTVIIHLPKAEYNDWAASPDKEIENFKGNLQLINSPRAENNV